MSFKRPIIDPLWAKTQREGEREGGRWGRGERSEREMGWGRVMEMEIGKRWREIKRMRKAGRRYGKRVRDGENVKGMEMERGGDGCIEKRGMERLRKGEMESKRDLTRWRERKKDSGGEREKEGER